MRQVVTKIMIAVDFSDYTEPSVEYGISLAKALNATLLMVNVVNSRDLFAMERYLAVQEPALYRQYIEETYAVRHDNLRRLMELAERQGVKGEMRVKTGVPYQELLKAIESETPDLLIMGTKGRSNLTDTLIGSCAHRMYRRCPIPLLSLRPQKK